MARRLLLTAALGLIFTATGCVSKEKYVAKDIELQQQRENANALQTALARSQAERDAVAKANSGLTEAAELERRRADLAAQQATELEKQNVLLMKKYEDELTKQPVVIGAALPAELNAALKQLAATHERVMEYDANRGMIKFRSDVTFPTSSDQLTPPAKTAVQQLAGILNSPAARNFEFLVAGHTDNVPVSKPETIRAGHKDNWYLSTHRAVSVAKELMANKVSAERVGALGYGEQRPIAANTTADGKARNRRVEVLILPTTVRSAGSTAAAGNAPANRPLAKDLNKDTAVDLRDQEPLLGK